MDLKMGAETISDGVEWDCKVSGGIVPMVSGEDEGMQCATMAGFLIKGTIPLLPDSGVPWTDFLLKKITFGELDFYVRESLNAAEKETYYPQYDIQGDRLTMSVGKLEAEINVA